jgi:hypothetical protein
MQSRGTKIQFTSRTPTAKELQECPHVVMTSPTSWNPQEVSLSSATTLPTESLPTSRISQISRVSSSVTRYEYMDPTSDEALLHSINPSLINFKEQMSNRTINQTTTYNKDLEDVPARRTFVSNERHFKITADLLAERFGIGPERLKATLRATTQWGLQSAILPIGRQYRADRMFDLKRLKRKFATDTLCLLRSGSRVLRLRRDGRRVACQHISPRSRLQPK